MVTAPKPPGSRASISPQSAVFEMAPAKVLQGAVRLHGLASSPTPDTQVRLAWACIITVPKMSRHNAANRFVFFIVRLFLSPLKRAGHTMFIAGPVHQLWCNHTSRPFGGWAHLSSRNRKFFG